MKEQKDFNVLVQAIKQMYVLGKEIHIEKTINCAEYRIRSIFNNEISDTFHHTKIITLCNLIGFSCCVRYDEKGCYLFVF